jgi:hypothetical protein
MRNRNRNASGQHGTGGPELTEHADGYSGTGLSQFTLHAANGGNGGTRRPRKFGRVVPKLPRCTPKMRRKRIPATPIAMIEHHEKLLAKLRDRLLTEHITERLDRLRRSIQIKSEYLERLRIEFVESRR